LYNVKYRLEDGSLQLALSGAVTAPTPVNLVNHVYFNLAGHKAGADGMLWRDMYIYIYYVSSRIED
jgi:aldose 1-epimerase